MKKIKGLKTTFTFSPSMIADGIAYSRQGLYILVTFKNGSQHNLPCATEEDAASMEKQLDDATAPV